MEVTIHPQYVGMSATAAYWYVSQYGTAWNHEFTHVYIVCQLGRPEYNQQMSMECTCTQTDTNTNLKPGLQIQHAICW